MKLITPSIVYEASYLNYLEELGDEVRVPFPLDYLHEPFSRLVKKLNDQSKGIGLQEGFVANTTYWLIDEEQIVGVSNLRHKLTPALELHGGHIGYGVRPSAQRNGFGTELLRLTLREAFARGIKRTLITCSQDNLGSIGVIQANGGVYEGESIEEATSIVVQRYGIDTN